MGRDFEMSRLLLTWPRVIMTRLFQSAAFKKLSPVVGSLGELGGRQGAKLPTHCCLQLFAR